jgi:hypothetical protein
MEHDFWDEIKDKYKKTYKEMQEYFNVDELSSTPKRDLFDFFDYKEIRIIINECSYLFMGSIKDLNELAYISKPDEIKTNIIHITKTWDDRENAEDEAFMKAAEILEKKS